VGEALPEFALGLSGARGETKMGKLVRTGLSLESDLLSAFDDAIAKKGYGNRSEAIRDLIRDHLVELDVDKNKVVVGTLTIVYDHHKPNLTEKLVSAQHHAGGSVLAATHVHLDHHNCLEVVIMKGRSGALKDLANGILSLRGVKHGQLVVTTTGKDLR
jgi:CopG family nickel-responsive transcriptional regulator